LEKKPSIRLIEFLKFLEFTTAMALFDQGVDVTAHQVDTGHQGQRAMR
jgi:hypothetical protein